MMVLYENQKFLVADYNPRGATKALAQGYSIIDAYFYRNIIYSTVQV